MAARVLAMGKGVRQFLPEWHMTMVNMQRGLKENEVAFRVSPK